MPGDDTSDSVPPTETVEAVHEHLAATAELPVDVTASTYLGEAEAVASDAVAAAHDDQFGVVRMRLEQVADLLSHVDTTGNATVDDHVAEARRLAEQVVASGIGD